MDNKLLIGLLIMAFYLLVQYLFEKRKYYIIKQYLFGQGASNIKIIQSFTKTRNNKMNYYYIVNYEDVKGLEQVIKCKVGLIGQVEIIGEKYVTKKPISEDKNNQINIEENYPHNVGMFNTMDENELLNRYIQLINLDDKNEASNDK
jgi:hypothetical protein